MMNNYTEEERKALIEHAEWLSSAFYGTTENGILTAKIARIALGAITTPPAASMVPDGWKLVPVEPTDEMVAAAMDCDDVSFDKDDDSLFYVHHNSIYTAMLAAAPSPIASE